jgi:hypothetical protein
VAVFLEFCEGKLIDYEDLATRGEPGMARKAANLRQILDDPAWRPVIADLLASVGTSGVTWGNA